MTDPWLTEETSHLNEININKQFEDSFVNPDKLPDSEEYLKSLEAKLAKLKKGSQLKSKEILSSLSEVKDCHLNRLVNSESAISLTDAELDDPVQTNVLRRLSSDRQAQTLGEIVELLKYDQLARALEPEDSTPTSN